MAEGIFPGTIGRITGNPRSLDKTADAMEKELAKFTANLSRMTGMLGTYLNSRSGIASSNTQGLTSQSSTASGNGGAVAFGQHTPTSHRAEGGPSYFGGGNGGERVGGPPDSGGGSHKAPNGGNAMMAGRRATGAGLAGLAIYTAGHQDSQILGQSTAAEFAYGSDWSSAYRAMIPNNYTAMNSADAAAGAAANARLGFRTTSSQYATMQAGTQSTSLVDPSISNAQSSGANAALAAPSGYNRMRAMGISTLDSGGAVDIRRIAQQILEKIPNYRGVTTTDQLFWAMGPSGPVEVTLQSWAGAGMIPPAALTSIRAQIRSILQAQIHGVSASKLFGLEDQFNSGSTGARSDASRQLNQLGIANSLIQNQKTREGMSRDTEAETIGGFTAGLKDTTAVLNRFRGALTKIMQIPGVGESTGFGSGIMSSVGGIVGATPLGKVFSMGKGAASLLPGVGGSSPTMSRGSVSMVGGGGFGGSTPNQSGNKAAGTGGGGGGGGGSAGVTFIAPRPGMDSMSSEQDFGPRTIGQGFHTGIDLEGGVGAPIKASAAGTVVGAGWGSSGDSGYGNTVMIDHGGGFVTMYAHMSSINVSKGDSVRQGQIIGAVGDTGSYSQGAHLHFELHINGKPVDPVPYLSGRRANIKPGSAGSGSSGPGGSGSKGSGATMGSTGAYNNGSRYGSSEEVSALGLGAGSSGLSAVTGSAGSAQTSAARGSTPAGSGSAGQNPSMSGISGGGSSAQNIALGKQMASKYGWAGSQWKDLLTLWNHESGWRTNADNPTSSAYGIPQALTDMHHLGGTSYMTDPKAQIQWGLNYIKGRYGSPSKAWDFWQAHNWYDKGIRKVEHTGTHTLHEGEMVLDATTASGVRNEQDAKGSRSGLRGQGQLVLTFQKDSINIHLASGSERDARQGAKYFVQAVTEDRQLQALMAGAL